MDHQALKTEIESGPLAAEIAPLLAEGNLDGVLGVLNDRRFPRITDTYVNARRLMSSLGAAVGATILDKLDATKAGDARLKWALSFMTDGGLNIGDPETRKALDDLAASGVLSTAERDAIKGLAEVPASQAEIDFGRFVTGAEVSIALRGGNEFIPGT
jgi:hypothetical protein